MPSSVRLAAHGEAWFPDPSRILEIMRHQCSAARAAYQAIHKHGLAGNDVKKRVKEDYMGFLNQRYVSDACSVASGIVQEGAIFGGKRNWERMVNGSLPKGEWLALRNGRLYSRGDRSKDGNPNIRIKGNRMFVNDPSERGRWIEGRVFIPGKFKPDWSCYDVRLIREPGETNRFRVVVGWEEEVGTPSPDFSNGAIGIDTNPDGLGVAEVDSKGNLVRHHYEREQRIQFAGKGKRDADIRLLAKGIVGLAKGWKKPLVVERLDFDPEKKKNGYRKFRRMKHNFVYRKIIEAIMSRAIKERVALARVEPAFTSKLGHLKYRKMYSLPVHDAAAMVIARRGMGIMERRTFSAKKADKPRKDGKIPWNLEGRWGSCTLSEKAWSWLRDRFLRPKPASLTGTRLAVVPKEGMTTGRSMASRAMCEPVPTTGRDGQEEILAGERKVPLGTW